MQMLLQRMGPCICICVTTDAILNCDGDIGIDANADVKFEQRRSLFIAFYALLKTCAVVVTSVSASGLTASGLSTSSLIGHEVSALKHQNRWFVNVQIDKFLSAMLCIQVLRVFSVFHCNYKTFKSNQHP